MQNHQERSTNEDLGSSSATDQMDGVIRWMNGASISALETTLFMFRKASTKKHHSPSGQAGEYRGEVNLTNPARLAA
jgi:hypothetical protein